MVDSLADSGAAGLVIELGRRWTQLPQALVAACDARSLPLITLAREVRFAAVAQAVGEQIVDQQLERAARGPEGPRDVHRAEHRRGRAGRHPRGRPASRRHRRGARERAAPRPGLPAGAGGGGTVLTTGRGGRPASSSTAAPAGTSNADGWSPEWGARSAAGAGWSSTSRSSPTERQIAMAERAAAALALHRLHDRQRDSAVRRTHHELIVGLLADPSTPGLLQRCEAAGLPSTRRQFVGVALRPVVDGSLPAGGSGRLEEVTAAVVHALHELRVPALVCHLDDDVRALLSFARFRRAAAARRRAGRPGEPPAPGRGRRQPARHQARRDRPRPARGEAGRRLRARR